MPALAVVDAALLTAIAFPVLYLLFFRSLIDRIDEGARAEATIKGQNELFRSAIEALPHPFYVLDASDRTVLLANSATNRYGINPIGVKCHKLTKGSDLTCAARGYPCPLDEVKVTKMPAKVEQICIAGDGAAMTMEVHGFPIFDARGEVARMIEYSIDISEQRKAEIALRQSEKLSSLGRMAAGIAHELNQPLNAVKGACQAVILNLRENLPMSEAEIIESLMLADQQVDRMDEIIRNMRIFAGRDRETESNLIDVNNLLRYPLNIIQKKKLETKGIDLRFDVYTEPLFVKGNEKRLQQVVVNLMLNAMDAIGDRMAAESRGGAGEHSGDHHIDIKAWPSDNGRSVLIRIADTGAGIPAGIVDKIFEPFFTTKGPDQGTGLGLAISRDIVLQHGGEIAVQSRPGEGTTFLISLPRDGNEEAGVAL
jgi:signal transduction histidine kinase